MKTEIADGWELCVLFVAFHVLAVLYFILAGRIFYVVVPLCSICLLVLVNFVVLKSQEVERDGRDDKNCLT